MLTDNFSQLFNSSLYMGIAMTHVFTFITSSPIHTVTQLNPVFVKSKKQQLAMHKACGADANCTDISPQSIYRVRLIQ